jgi:hypothetical protein
MQGIHNINIACLAALNAHPALAAALILQQGDAFTSKELHRSRVLSALLTVIFMFHVQDFDMMLAVYGTAVWTLFLGLWCVIVPTFAPSCVRYVELSRTVK